MGKETAKLGIDVLDAVTGSLIFPSYCRTQCDKIGDNLHYDNKEELVTIDGVYVPEANRIRDKSDYALSLGMIASVASIASQFAYIDGHDSIPKSIAYGGSLILGTNLLSGLYEWFRNTKNRDTK